MRQKDFQLLQEEEEGMTQIGDMVEGEVVVLSLEGVLRWVVKLLL